MAGITCKLNDLRQLRWTMAYQDAHDRPMKSNPFDFWGKVIDCGDIPVTS